MSPEKSKIDAILDSEDPVGNLQIWVEKKLNDGLTNAGVVYKLHRYWSISVDDKSKDTILTVIARLSSHLGNTKCKPTPKIQQMLQDVLKSDAFSNASFGAVKKKLRSEEIDDGGILIEFRIFRDSVSGYISEKQKDFLLDEMEDLYREK